MPPQQRQPGGREQHFSHFHRALHLARPRVPPLVFRPVVVVDVAAPPPPSPSSSSVVAVVAAGRAFALFFFVAPFFVCLGAAGAASTASSSSSCSAVSDSGSVSKSNSLLAGFVAFFALDFLVVAAAALRLGFAPPLVSTAAAVVAWRGEAALADLSFCWCLAAIADMADLKSWVDLEDEGVFRELVFVAVMVADAVGFLIGLSVLLVWDADVRVEVHMTTRMHAYMRRIR